MKRNDWKKEDIEALNILCKVMYHLNLESEQQDGVIIQFKKLIKAKNKLLKEQKQKVLGYRYGVYDTYYKKLTNVFDYKYQAIEEKNLYKDDYIKYIKIQPVLIVAKEGK